MCDTPNKTSVESEPTPVVADYSSTATKSKKSLQTLAASADTIATSPLGDQSQATIGKKYLLGD